MAKQQHRTFRAQKAGLTRAIRSGDSEKIRAECERVVNHDWRADSSHTPYWPDDWQRWLRALKDAYPYGQAPTEAVFGSDVA